MWSSILVRCHTRLHHEFLQKCGRVKVFRIKKVRKVFFLFTSSLNKAQRKELVAQQ